MSKSTFQQIKDSLKTDTRGRLVLGEHFKNKQFSFEVNNDGVIRLVPMVTVPEKEAWLFKNKTAAISLKKGLEQSAKKQTKSLGRFAEYGSLDEDSLKN